MEPTDTEIVDRSIDTMNDSSCDEKSTQKGKTPMTTDLEPGAYDNLNNRFRLFDYLDSQRSCPMGFDEEKKYLLYYFCMIPGHEDREGMFVLDTFRNRFRCEHCRKEGGIVELIAAVEGLSYEDAELRLTTQKRRTISSDGWTPSPAHSVSIIAFLASRGVQPATCDEYLTEVPFRCPLPDHYDHNPSFSVNVEKNLWYCHGCNHGGDVVNLVMLLDDIGYGEAVRYLLEGPDVTTRDEVAPSGQLPLPSGPASAPGCTLEQLASAKHIPIEFLAQCGWSTIANYCGAPAVRIPYSDEDGEVKSVRFRVGLVGDRFRWRSDSKPMPYGIWHLAEARARGHVILVEGETDAVTLWHHGYAALGVPGSMWRREWSPLLDGIETVYVMVEPDAGGETLLSALSRSSIAQRLFVVRLGPDAKDASALHLLDPSAFGASMDRLLDEASAPEDPHEQTSGLRTKASAEAWERCCQLGLKADILDEFAQSAASRGVAGEDRALKLLYLVMTSRVLDQPVSAVVKGPSSSGKSYLVKHVAKHFPKSSSLILTSMSEKALAYLDEPLAHRVLIVYEAAGLMGEFASYLVRTLISEGDVNYLSVNQTDEGFASRTRRIEGPISLVLTTTNVNLHPENETRLVSIPVDDSRDQTRRVMSATARRRERPATADNGSLAQWCDLQIWLEGAEHRVEIPFAKAISDLTPPVSTNLRRGLETLLSLIETHAVLHQATRERTVSGWIIATLVDYEVARELAGDLLARRAGAQVSTGIRETVSALNGLVPAVNAEEGISVNMLAGRMSLDRHTVGRRVNEAINLGYITNMAPSGRPRRLVVGDPIPVDAILFPTVEELRACAGVHAEEGSPLPLSHDHEQRDVWDAEAHGGYAEEELELLSLELDPEYLEYSWEKMRRYGYLVEKYGPILGEAPSLQDDRPSPAAHAKDIMTEEESEFLTMYNEADADWSPERKARYRGLFEKHKQLVGE